MTQQGVLLEINAAATSLLGYLNSDIVGRPVSMLYPPSEESRIAACFAELAEVGTSRYIDGIALARDGTRIAVDVVGSLIGTGAETTVIAVVRDIRQRKQVEMALQAERDRFYLLAEHIREIFWIFDPSTRRFEFASPAFNELARIAGCASGNDIRCWMQAVVPPDRSRFEHFLATLEHGEPADVELRLGMKDGTVRWIHCRAFPWSSDGGRPRVAGVVDDITERKHNELQKIEHARRQRETLVREAHHRMKNSLQGVIGLLRRCAGEHPGLASALTGAISQVRSIAVIHELQTRTTGGPVLLGELGTMIASSIEGLFDVGVKMRVSNRLDNDVALAESEAVPLAVALNELLINAAKHLRAHNDETERTIDVEFSGDADAAWVIVSHFGTLPPGFDFSARRGLGQGLELIAALLPEDHAKLEFSQHDGRVLTRLALLPPAINVYIATENHGPA